MAECTLSRKDIDAISGGGLIGKEALLSKNDCSVGATLGFGRTCAVVADCCWMHECLLLLCVVCVTNETSIKYVVVLPCIAITVLGQSSTLDHSMHLCHDAPGKFTAQARHQLGLH